MFRGSVTVLYCRPRREAFALWLRPPSAFLGTILLLATPMRTRLLVILALALCAFLRFYHLDGYGLWSDEFVTLLIVSSNSFKDLIQTCFDVPQPMPPLYFLVNKWSRLCA